MKKSHGDRQRMLDEYKDEFDALYQAIRFYIITNQLETKISVSRDDDVLINPFSGSGLI